MGTLLMVGGSAAEGARLGFPLLPASPAGRSGHGCACRRSL